MEERGSAGSKPLTPDVGEFPCHVISLKFVRILALSKPLDLAPTLILPLFGHVQYIERQLPLP